MDTMVRPGTSVQEDSSPNPRGLVRDSRTMAIGTAASRVTGFLRTAMLVVVLGLGGVRQGFDVANTLPNSLYELLLGGVLTSTLVPLLVRARARDDHEAYTQRLLTLVLLTLTALTALAMVAAPPLVRLYSRSPEPGQIDLSVAWARFFLPQILFYGMSATVGAVLNTRGRFAAPVWAPVLNNLVVIATLGAFTLVPGPGYLTPLTLTIAQQLVLGIGTTLGVVVMSAALLPSLRASGFHWRLRWDFRGMGLLDVGRMAAWTVVYVVAVQLAFIELSRLLTAVGELPQYTTALVVWQLPYAVVAVSVITALLPRMSRQAVDGRPDLLRRELDRGLRLAALILVPAALAFVVLGRPVAVTLFAHGPTTYAGAERIGLVLGVLAIGLLPSASYQFQSRAFYAIGDTRTPALIQVLVSTLMVLLSVLAASVLPDDARVYGLALAIAISNGVGAVVTAMRVRRRFGSAAEDPEDRPSTRVHQERRQPTAGHRDRPQPTARHREPQQSTGRHRRSGQSTASALVRMLVAGLVGAAAAAGVALALTPAVPRDWLGAAVVLVVAGLADLVVYARACLLLGVAEANAVVAKGRSLRLHAKRDRG